MLSGIQKFIYIATNKEQLWQGTHKLLKKQLAKDWLSQATHGYFFFESNVLSVAKAILQNIPQEV